MSDAEACSCHVRPQLSDRELEAREVARRAAELIGEADDLTRVAAATEPFSAPFPTPEYPPAEWFDRPTWVASWRTEHGLGPDRDPSTGVLKLTVTDDGRVGGYFFENGQCIVHMQDACPGPSPTRYAAFHQQDVVTEGGKALLVGVIGNVHGHASPYVDFQRAQAHYADPSSQMILCRAGDDERGGWIAGAVVPGLTYGDVALLRRSGLSGDWRPMPAQWWKAHGVTAAAVRAAEGYDCIGPTLVTRPALPLVQKFTLGSRAAAILGGAAGVQLEAAYMAAGYDETLHPRGEHGKWAAKDEPGGTGLTPEDKAIVGFDNAVLAAQDGAKADLAYDGDAKGGTVAVNGAPTYAAKPLGADPAGRGQRWELAPLEGTATHAQRHEVIATPETIAFHAGYTGGGQVTSVEGWRVGTAVVATRTALDDARSSLREGDTERAAYNLGQAAQHAGTLGASYPAFGKASEAMAKQAEMIGGGQIPQAATASSFDESLHPRDRGRFSEKAGGGYVPQGRTDQESYDYTDDPRQLAMKFDREELQVAAEDAHAAGKDEALLKFDYEEWVPLPAVEEAIRLATYQASVWPVRTAYTEEQLRDEGGKFAFDAGGGRGKGGDPKGDRPPGTVTKKGVVVGNGDTVKIGDKVAVSYETGLSFDRFRSTAYGKVSGVDEVKGIEVKLKGGDKVYYKPEDVSTGPVKLKENAEEARVSGFLTGKGDVLETMAELGVFAGDVGGSDVGPGKDFGKGAGKGGLGDLAKAFGAATASSWWPDVRTAGDWREELHPRDRGKFSTKEGDPATEPAGKALAQRFIDGEQGIVLPVEDITAFTDQIAAFGKAEKDSGAGTRLNLCEVEVPGTNLFCGDNQGIPRQEMPQLKGAAVPGSPAEALTNAQGEADITPGFLSELRGLGVKMTDDSVPSNKLKSTQSELVGEKVAGIAKAIESGKLDVTKEPIIVSKDNYVLDGHHRWAGQVLADAEDGHLGDSSMPVIRVDMGILDLVKAANGYADEQGIAQKGTTQGSVRAAAGVWDESLHPREHGKFSSKGGGPDAIVARFKVGKNAAGYIHDAVNEVTRQGYNTPDEERMGEELNAKVRSAAEQGVPLELTRDELATIVDGAHEVVGHMDYADPDFIDPEYPPTEEEAAAYQRWYDFSMKVQNKLRDVDQAARGAMTAAAPEGNAQALRDWYNAGADGQINWGEHGAFDACVAIASNHMDEEQAKGFCAERHNDATGKYPGARSAAVDIPGLRAIAQDLAIHQHTLGVKPGPLMSALYSATAFLERSNEAKAKPKLELAVKLATELEKRNKRVKGLVDRIEQAADMAPPRTAATKTEGGTAFPASDYAYVPDAGQPSTWKLRLTTSPGGAPDAGMVGRAITALGKGYRGNKVSLPLEDREKVKARLRGAWKRANPGRPEKEMPDVVRQAAADELEAATAAPGDGFDEGKISRDKSGRFSTQDEVNAVADVVAAQGQGIPGQAIDDAITEAQQGDGTGTLQVGDSALTVSQPALEQMKGELEAAGTGAGANKVDPMDPTAVRQFNTDRLNHVAELNGKLNAGEITKDEHAQSVAEFDKAHGMDATSVNEASRAYGRGTSGDLPPVGEVLFNDNPPGHTDFYSGHPDAQPGSVEVIRNGEPMGGDPVMYHDAPGSSIGVGHLSPISDTELGANSEYANDVRRFPADREGATEAAKWLAQEYIDRGGQRRVPSDAERQQRGDALKQMMPEVFGSATASAASTTVITDLYDDQGVKMGTRIETPDGTRLEIDADGAPVAGRRTAAAARAAARTAGPGAADMTDLGGGADPMADPNAPADGAPVTRKEFDELAARVDQCEQMLGESMAAQVASIIEADAELPKYSPTV